MNDNDDKFDSAEAVRQMNARHARYGLLMQELAVRGLAELEKRGNLTKTECAELLEAGLKLESSAAPTVSRKRH